MNFVSDSIQSLIVQHAASLNSPYVTVFVVGRLNANSQSKASFLAKTSDKNMDDGYGLIRMNSKEKIRFFAGNYGVNRDSEHTHYGVFDLMVGNYRTGSSSDKITTLVNNAGSGTKVLGVSNPSYNDLYIGARPNLLGGLRSYLDGDIAEVIIMASDLPSVERIIISNYLAAKYGFAISNDKYAHHSTHPNGVIGIGNYGGVTHVSSKNDVLEIAEDPSKPLGGSTFLMVGHDGGELTGQSTNLPEDYSIRLKRTWKAHSNGYIQRELVRFHMGAFDIPDNGEFALLLDHDGDGDFSNASAVETASFDVTSGIVEFSGVHLHTGTVFTLAYFKKIILGGTTTPSPGPGDGGRTVIVTTPGDTLVGDASVYDLIVDSGATLVIDPSICLTVNRNIINNGTITIQEEGSLIQRSEGINQNSGTGTYVFKRTGLNSDDGYNNWSSPMNSVNIKTVFPFVNDCDLLTYSGFTQNWSHDFALGYSTTCNGNSVTFNAGNVIANGDGLMDIGRGYFIHGNTVNPQKTFEGEVNNGDYIVPIVSTEFGHNVNWNDDDWNLVGNPYPSALDPYAFWQENAVDNQRITDALYFWDDLGLSGGAYDQYNDYASWNLTGGIASDNSSKVISTVDHIASGQGFMLWASDQMGNDSTSVFRGGQGNETVKVSYIKFDNSMRSCNNSLFYKDVESSKELNWLQVESPSGNQSRLLLGTVLGATDQLDAGFDARRTKFTSNPHIEFSSMIGSDTTGYHIQGLEPLNALNSDKKVALKVTSDEAGTHLISRAAFQKGGAPLEMYLRDNVLNVIHNFEEGDYSFFMNSNDRLFNRFEIWFEYDGLNNNGSGSKGGVTSVQDIENNFTVHSVENGFQIYSSKGIEGTLKVYDVSGRQLLTEIITSMVTEKNITLSVSTGVYFVQIEDHTGSIQTQRLVIQ